MYDVRSDIDYILSGRVEKLEETDYEVEIKVQVAISAQMTNLASGTTNWTNEVLKLLTPAPAMVGMKKH